MRFPVHDRSKWYRIMVQCFQLTFMGHVVGCNMLIKRICHYRNMLLINKKRPNISLLISDTSRSKKIKCFLISFFRRSFFSKICRATKRPLSCSETEKMPSSSNSDSSASDMSYRPVLTIYSRGVLILTSSRTSSYCSGLSNIFNATGLNWKCCGFQLYSVLRLTQYGFNHKGHSFSLLLGLKKYSRQLISVEEKVFSKLNITNYIHIQSLTV